MSERRLKARGYPVVLLDVDGTLIDTKRLYMEAYRSAVLPYIGKDLSTAEIMAFRPRCEIRFLRDVVGADRLNACLADFHQAYAALHPEFFRGIYPGIPELLSKLREERLPLGIITGKSRRSWEITVRHSPLGDFDALVFADDVAEPKPDPEGIQIALDQIGAEPEDAIYLGDSISDMEAAIAAGVRPAGAVWAKRPEDRERFIDRIAVLGAPVYHSPAEFMGEVLQLHNSR